MPNFTDKSISLLRRTIGRSILNGSSPISTIGIHANSNHYTSHVERLHSTTSRNYNQLAHKNNPLHHKNNKRVHSPQMQEALSTSSAPSHPSHQVIAGITIPNTSNLANFSDVIQETVNLLEKHSFKSDNDIYRLAQSAKTIIPNLPKNDPDVRKYGGHLVKVSADAAGTTILVKVKPDEVKQADIIYFPGLDGADVVAGHIVGGRAFANMLNTAEKKYNVVSYFSKAPRSDRYEEGLYFLTNERHTPEYAIGIARNIFMPLLKNQDNEFLQPEDVKPVVLGCHSLGSREALMALNGLYTLLKREHFKDDKIQAYLNRFVRFSLGHGVATSWTNGRHPNTLISPGISVLALADKGIRQVDSTMQAVFYNTALSNNDVTLLRRKPAEGEKNSNEVLAVVGDTRVPVYTTNKRGIVLNELGHSMAGYSSTRPVSIYEDSGILNIIRNHLNGASHQEISTQIAALSSKPFEVEQSISPSAFFHRSLQWAQDLLAIEELRETTEKTQVTSLCTVIASLDPQQQKHLKLFLSQTLNEKFTSRDFVDSGSAKLLKSIKIYPRYSEQRPDDRVQLLLSAYSKSLGGTEIPLILYDKEMKDKRNIVQSKSELLCNSIYYLKRMSNNQVSLSR